MLSLGTGLHLRSGSNQTVYLSDLCFSIFLSPLGAYSADLELISIPMPLPHSPLSWQSTSLCPRPLLHVSFLADHRLSGGLSITPCLMLNTDKALLQNGNARWYRILPGDLEFCLPHSTCYPHIFHKEMCPKTHDFKQQQNITLGVQENPQSSQTI